MPWFKVDDELHDHKKRRKAGAHAMGLWVIAGSWCADNLTDGFVPEDVLSRWDRKWRSLAGLLCAADLWETAIVDGERGYLFHDWSEYQPTAETVKAERAAARKRMQERRANRARSSVDVRANTQRTPAERSPLVLVPDPTRPAELEPTVLSSIHGSENHQRLGLNRANGGDA